MLAQSEEASSRWAAHRGRVATAEGLATLLVEEGRMAMAVKAELIKQLPSSDPLKVAQIENTLEHVDGKLRTVSILQAAGGYLAAITVDSGSGQVRHDPDDHATNGVLDELTEHWLDKFFELTRARNESWRADLLAKALAQETANPGSMSLTVLWKIGTLSAEEFHGLAHMFDVAFQVPWGPLIVPFFGFWETEVPECLLPNHRAYEHVATMLDEAGLLHLPLYGEGRSLQIRAGESFVARYANREVHVVTQKPTELTGVLFSTTAIALANLYHPKTLPLGFTLFETALAALRAKDCKVSEQVIGAPHDAQAEACRRGFRRTPATHPKTGKPFRRPR